ncbi:MAG: DNA polymerase III subunit gamma/tau [Beijerinckiaceae bacterium]
MADTSQHGAYRVLARKYRPKGFEDLIGQDAMVRTFRNAFAINRIHQAYIFTGVRGVGKTTTARIIARALNYEKDDGSVTTPTIAMPDYGKHCESIIESRHIDVIEMDAASNTGVDHVREIIEAVKYRPAYARYKVYIIDEVHMLSTSSFNALLKTLEEPPEHVKFLFATTEIRKVPITVLSRCQRFDLKRIDAPLMIRHLGGIAEQEKITIEDEALALIARAGEGSVRDCLSLLDQAIAHGSGTIAADQIRDMLGLADRARIVDLFEQVMRGDIQAALSELSAQYDSGADPVSIITDLAEYVHTVTRLKLAPNVQADPSLSENEKARGQAFARDLSIRVLTRAWQILIKGLPETQTAPRPIVAAEMLLVRLAYAADLPTPDEALKMLRDGSGAASGGAASPRGNGGGGGATASVAARPVMVAASPAPAIQPQAATAAPSMRINSFQQLVALASEKRDPLLVSDLERHVRLVRFEDGLLEFALAPGADTGIVQRVTRRLQEWTGRRWTVALSNEEGEPTLRELADAKRNEEESLRHSHPVVQAVLKMFPGATVIPAAPKIDVQPALSASELAAQPIVNEDGDVVASEGDFTEDDL